jgi:hypothetical protein
MASAGNVQRNRAVRLFRERLQARGVKSSPNGPRGPWYTRISAIILAVCAVAVAVFGVVTKGHEVFDLLRPAEATSQRRDAIRADMAAMREDLQRWSATGPRSFIDPYVTLPSYVADNCRAQDRGHGYDCNAPTVSRFGVCQARVFLPESDDSTLMYQQLECDSIDVAPFSSAAERYDSLRAVATQHFDGAGWTRIATDTGMIAPYSVFGPSLQGDQRNTAYRSGQHLFVARLRRDRTVSIAAYFDMGTEPAMIYPRASLSFDNELYKPFPIEPPPRVRRKKIDSVAAQSPARADSQD